MGLTTSKKIVTIILVLWLFTIFRSVTIMIGGKKLFAKASRGEKSHLYPIINLFTMLEIADVSSYFGILLFIPILNLIVLVLMSIKIGKVFKVKTL